MNFLNVSTNPNSTLKVSLNGQNCVIELRTLNDKLYFSMTSNGVQIETNTICRNNTFLVSNQYLGFDGNLMFIDTQGDNDPTWDGIGSRYKLAYYTGAEIG